MTSPRRLKRVGGPSSFEHLDWDSPSNKTGTVKRRPTSCPEKNHKNKFTLGRNIEFEESSGDETNERLVNSEILCSSDPLADVERRIHDLLSRASVETGNNLMDDENQILNPQIHVSEEIITVTLTDISDIIEKPKISDKNAACIRSKTYIKEEILTPPAKNEKISKASGTIDSPSEPDIQIVSSEDIIKTDSDLKHALKNCSTLKRKPTSKLRLPFSPSKTSKSTQDAKISSLLNMTPRRTISNEYVKLKFSCDTLSRKTNVSRVPQVKMVPNTKIPSIIPESPVDMDDPFLNLSPNKKYTVTSDKGIRYDKENYVVFDPDTGFDANSQGKKSRIPLKSPDKSGNPGFSRLSNISDTDSGILSPNSTDVSADESNYVNSRVLVKAVVEHRSEKVSACDGTVLLSEFEAGSDGTGFVLDAKAVHQIKIYTDWANHYLERARSRRRAGGGGAALARDCADGVLLGDVVEGVTGRRVPRPHRKPRNEQQMLENVQACLDFLHSQRVQGLEQVTAADIRDGKLKAVLALFFALSRHKQSAKTKAPSLGSAPNELTSATSVQRITGGAGCDESTINNAGMTTLAANRQQALGGPQTCIPLPGSVRRDNAKRPLPAAPPLGYGGKSGNALSASSSRSTSPSGQGHVASFIPRAPGVNSGSRPNSSILAPGSKIPASPFIQQQTVQNAPQNKQSMLDKLKLFNKEKDKQKSTPIVSKRTSSSSGFSSAKSERSDSSLSLNESANAPPNTHIRQTNIVGPKNVRSPLEANSKENINKCSSKNIKSKLLTSKPTKESSIAINKGTLKSNSSDKAGRGSPKLPAKDKESRLAAPKSIVNSKPTQDYDGRNLRPPGKPQETKIMRLSASQLKLNNDRVDMSRSPNDMRPAGNNQISHKGQSLSTNSSSTTLNSQMGVPGTGIPKPTAAVKGTFKMPKDDRSGTRGQSQLSPIQSNSSLVSVNSNNSNVHPFSREHSNLSKETMISQKQTLAVSPMPVPNEHRTQAINHNLTSQMSESSHSNSTHSASTGQHSNSSESSVIYKPSSESGSDISKAVSHPIIPNRKLDHSNSSYITDVISEAEHSEKEAARRRENSKRMVQEQANNRQVNETKQRVEVSKETNYCDTSSHGRDNSLGDDENPLMNVLPMRPLLRGYNSHLTLPIRASPGLSQKTSVTGYPHHANTVKANFGRDTSHGMGMREGSRNFMPGFSNPDYCDLEMASGYMSDGDCLRRLNISEVERSKANSDMMDGYMSEGGASLYGRRIAYQHQNGPPLQSLDERSRAVHHQSPGSGRPMDPNGVVYRVVRAKKTDSSQQTEKVVSSNGHNSKNGDSQWKKYTDSPGVGTPVQSSAGGPGPAPVSPSHSRKSDRERRGRDSPQRRDKPSAAQQLGVAPHPHQFSPSPNQHSPRTPQLPSPSLAPSPSPASPRPGSAAGGGAGGGGKAKVPQSFGYVKRQNGTAPQPQGGGNVQHHSGGRTAQVSAVPRTKVKVSGGTQTCTQDLQIHKNGIGPKSYSLGGSAAAQLSASVRERLLGSQSLPKPGTHDFAALFQHHRISPRGGIKISDGSLSDTQTYSEVKSDYGIPYAPWLRHSNTYSASASGGRLSEGESLESLLCPGGGVGVSGGVGGAGGSGGRAHKAGPATHHPAARLNRSNSIRSTKSEKLYPSMLQRSSESDYEPYYCLPVQYGPQGQGLNYGLSEPPSPSPRSALSPTHTNTHAHSAHAHTHTRHSLHYAKKNDEVHGSSASLSSSASLAAEERRALEVRRLRRELADAKDKVHTLTTQLTTNAHVVSAFEQSLSNMTQRLQQLTATAERKDSEVTELRQTIELLRKQSIQAGLTTAHMQSMGIRADGVNVTPHSQNQNEPQPPKSSSPAQQSSPQRKPSSLTPCQGNGVITRHLSTDSVSSINSISSGSSAAHDKKLKKKGWLRSSFTKAFSRNAKISKTAKHSSLGQLSSSSGGASARFDPHTIREGSHENSLEHSHEVIVDGQLVGSDKGKAGDTTNTTEKSAEDAVLVDELKRQLREKDLVLTDIRLEALSSAHQLESLKDTVVKMRNEMLNLKQNNERLQRMVTSRSLAGSQSSIGTGPGDDPRRFSLADQGTMHQNMDLHPQPLDLDFNCMTSTPTNDFTKKLSPLSNEPIYGNNGCELTADGDALLASLSAREGDEDMFSNSDGMRSDRMSGGEYVDDIDTLLPPPRSRELAIGESYSDMGGTENQGDTADGKKIAIAVYLGQPDTFQRYYEEVQDTLSESEVRFYQSKQASYHTSYDSPRMSQNHSPESEKQMLPGTQDYSQSIANKSNTNSLKSNKSSHSTTFNNLYTSDTTINTNEFTIAYTYISGKTTWQNLDYIVRKTFKDYLSRIDPGTNLGLNTDSITSYHLGDATRGPEISFPELLPCGYIVGTVNTLYICLQGVGSLAFDSLIPKNIVYRYISLLSEHRRVILCGPSGTGKSYLATKLAEFYVRRTQRRANPAEAVATFNVERKSAAELRAYLGNIAEQCGAAGGDAALPSVLLLDNLQHASALGDAFVGLRASHATHMPVIIGTMSQATCNTTNLQLQHNFRWLLTSNHMEPVKGFLARYLRRKLVSVELERGARLAALGAVLEWLPAVWQHLNAYLEAHSSSDVAIGPRLFLACPMDLQSSQVWFAEVWNSSVVPYVRSAVREGVALYGRRRGPPDPLAHVKHTYPWREPNHSHTLLGISLEDIGLDETTKDTNGTNNQDPLLNMLMRLQEAANYSGEQSQDSDNISLDSNLTHDSSAGNEI